MICQCGSNKIENREKMLCASCNKLERISLTVQPPKEFKPINRQSEKLKRLLGIYARKKAKWIKGKKCAVMPHLPAVDIHHIAGRGHEAFYDEWAMQNEIPLLLDERFWLPVSREGHIEITNRPAWAKKMGFSEDRLIPMKMRSYD